MVYLPRDKAAWAILSELNMCVLHLYLDETAKFSD